MTKVQDIVDDVASRIRKIEEMVDMSKKATRILEHEIKCLHRSLERGMKLASLTVDEGGIQVYGGGTPKRED